MQFSIHSPAGVCVLAASVLCWGFMLRATISKIIPAIVRAIPERKEALGIHQYHGNTLGTQPGYAQGGPE